LAGKSLPGKVIDYFWVYVIGISSELELYYFDEDYFALLVRV
jgi:hypothetical protein